MICSTMLIIENSRNILGWNAYLTRILKRNTRTQKKIRKKELTLKEKLDILDKCLKGRARRSAVRGATEP